MVRKLMSAPAGWGKVFVSLLALTYLAAATVAALHSRLLVVIVLGAVFAGISLVRPVPHPRGGILEPNSPVTLTASLLWTPGEALLGVGLGSLVGLLVFRRTDGWRAVNNATAWALTAAVAARTAGFIRDSVPDGLLTITLAAVAAEAVSIATNTAVFALVRSSRYHRPLLEEWAYGISGQGWLIRLSDLPPAILAAAVAGLVGAVPVALVMTAGSALVVPVARWYSALYMDRTMRARADAALHWSEQRFRAMTAHISDGIALLTADGTVLYVSPSGSGVLGYSSIDVVGRSWLTLYPPEEAGRARGLLSTVMCSSDGRAVSELQMKHQDGSWRWMKTVYANLTMEPSVQAIVVTYRDITGQKRVEETLEEYAARLEDLSRQLVQAQETERRTIARELHDEVGQTLTALRLTLDVARQQAGDADVSGILTSLTRVSSMVETLQMRVRTLSFALRPSALDDQGLLPAVLLHCDQYMAHTPVRVQITHSGVGGRRFPPEVETTAYRVVQESLTNVARHAGVAAAIVRLWADEDVLGVQIEDAGQGFAVDPALSAMNSGGLSGMRERVKLLRGDFALESAPGSGTRVTAELPLRQPLRHRAVSDAPV